MHGLPTRIRKWHLLVAVPAVLLGTGLVLLWRPPTGVGAELDNEQLELIDEAGRKLSLLTVWIVNRTPELVRVQSFTNMVEIKVAKGWISANTDDRIVGQFMPKRADYVLALIPPDAAACRIDLDYERMRAWSRFWSWFRAQFPKASDRIAKQSVIRPVLIWLEQNKGGFPSPPLWRRMRVVLPIPAPRTDAAPARGHHRRI